MSAYKKMRVSYLREACEERGIDCVGLKKRELVEALRRHDANRERGGQTDRNGMQNGGESDEEVTFRAVNEPLWDSGSIAGSLTPSDVEDGNVTESDSVSIMRLKLALVKEERKKERERDERAREMKQLEWQIEREPNEMLAGQTTPAIRPVMRGDVSSVLPKMSDDDPLVFFSAFERALQLNGVDKVDWPKFLASCLTVKANKVLALSLIHI